MDSNPNSCDVFWPKIEVDSDNEEIVREPKREHHKKIDTKLIWTSENTLKLIETLEKDCKELWDNKNPLNKDRMARQVKSEYLANMFGTSTDEITRKIHNLRTQYNNELRKIKKRQASSSMSGSEGVLGGSCWEYFDALTFLPRATSLDPLSVDSVDSVNLAGECQCHVSETLSCEEALSVEGHQSVKNLLAEFQAQEEEEFGAAARANSTPNTFVELTPLKSRVGRPALRVAASAPPPLPPSSNPMLWPEEPKLRPGANSDECQIFGDFVAAELRTLRSMESRKRLKRMIQKAILEIGEEEDMKSLKR